MSPLIDYQETDIISFLKDLPSKELKKIVKILVEELKSRKERNYCEF